MRKHILKITTLSTIILGLTTSATFAQEEISNNIDISKDVVAVKFTSGSLGGKLDWNGSQRLVTITLGANEVKFILGDRNIKVNGETEHISSASQIVGSLMFIPISPLVEALGKEMFWSSEGTIVISDTEETLKQKKEIKDMLDKKKEEQRDPLQTFMSSINKKVLEREAQQSFYFSEKQIIRLLGQPTSKSQPIEYGYGGEHQDWIYKGKGIEIDMNRFDDGGYSSSFIYLKSDFKYKTKEGIGIGSTKQEVIEAYGDIIENYEEDLDGNDLIVIGPSRDSGLTLGFKNNRVDRVQMGEHPN